MHSEGQQSPRGMAFFSSAHYRVHNEARLQHLASLNLPLHGRVLEVGSGPGDHTGFYLERNCAVVSTDARPECVQQLKERYPQVEVRQIDMNRPEGLEQLGVFDIVHCYGLLYHLEAPERAIVAMANVCSNLLLLETCVSPGTSGEINPVNEVLGDYTQSTTGHACRPTRAWVFETLKRYFPYVYQTRTQPIHPEFPTDWTTIPEYHGLVRIVLVASRTPYDIPVLSPVLLDHQERLPTATRAEVELRDAAIESLHHELERAHAAIAELNQAATERLTLLEEAHVVIARLNTEFEALRHTNPFRYFVCCLKNQVARILH